MQRVTIAELQSIIDRINRVTGSPMLPYSMGDDGHHRANPGNYHLSRAYGGFCLHRMSTTGGGVRTPLMSYHVPARELRDQMLAYVYSLEAAREAA